MGRTPKKQLATAQTRRKARARRRVSKNNRTDSVVDTPQLKEINVKDLDLDKSYVGIYEPPTLPSRPERRKWKKQAHDESANRIPEGWSADEPDLDPDDIEGHISRCEERIDENIMPQIFRKRLVAYQKRLEDKRALMAKYPGLSWAVVRRIEDLKGIRAWFTEINDKYELLHIADGLIAAYESGSLDWIPGLVTYWAKGAQISQPRPFDINEYCAIAAAYEGWKNFWVEGYMMGESSKTMRLEMTRCTPTRPNTFQNELQMELQLQLAGSSRPGALRWPLDFIDDSGSDYMCIYDEDLEDMVTYYANNGRNGFAPLFFPTCVSLANGSRIRCIVRGIWTSIFHPNSGHRMTASSNLVQCICWDHDRNAANAPKRINGPWLRSKLYTASAPEGEANLWIFNNKAGFVERVPAIPWSQRTYPVLPPRLT